MGMVYIIPAVYSTLSSGMNGAQSPSSGSCAPSHRAHRWLACASDRLLANIEEVQRLDPQRRDALRRVIAQHFCQKGRQNLCVRWNCL